METGEKNDDRFLVWAETDSHSKPLIMKGLPVARLFDDIVVPYQMGETFFLDGASVTAKELKRLKILRAKQPYLDDALGVFQRALTRGEGPIQKTYGEQYHVRFEAILRENSEDVTAQIIKAYDRAIRPSIKDYLPKREELINAATSFFMEAVKRLGTS